MLLVLTKRTMRVRVVNMIPSILPHPTSKRQTRITTLIVFKHFLPLWMARGEEVDLHGQNPKTPQPYLLREKIKAPQTHWQKPNPPASKCFFLRPWMQAHPRRKWWRRWHHDDQTIGNCSHLEQQRETNGSRERCRDLELPNNTIFQISTPYSKSQHQIPNRKNIFQHHIPKSQEPNHNTKFQIVEKEKSKS